MAQRLVVRPALVWLVGCRRAARGLVLDYACYVLCELSYARAAKLEDDPAAGEVLFFRVSYPLRRVLVAVKCGGHGGFFSCLSSQ